MSLLNQVYDAISKSIAWMLVIVASLKDVAN